MKKDILQQAENYNKEHQKKQRWRKVLTVMAAIVVFCTTYALIIPAITWERSLICDIPEHTHSDACYETVSTVGEITCGLEEHVHDDACYKEVTTYSCGLEEGQPHVHTDACHPTTERALTCEEDHEHTDACYEEVTTYGCGLEEGQPHVHTDACHPTTEKVLECDKKEHTHTDACRAEGTTERKLVCTLKEHQHDDTCYDAPPKADRGYYCGHVEHTHTDACYYDDGSLRCTLEEHTHTAICKSNPKADLETKSDWEATFKDVKLTGNWAEDVLAIAATQEGYKESDKNFIIDENGNHKGYTRYGGWYGVPYGDWCAMFCSFCIDYAGVNDFPLDSSCVSWIKALSADENNPDKPVYFHLADGSYAPHPGDLIFFDWDVEEEPANNHGNNGNHGNKPAQETEKTPEEIAAEKEAYEKKISGADHVGLVTEVTPGKNKNFPGTIKTIEGNNGGVVAYHTYDDNNVKILGYGEMPINPNAMEEQTIESQPASDGATVAISGNLPVGAQPVLEAIDLDRDSVLGYFDAERADQVNSYVVYDIKITVDGKEWQPAPNEEVSVVLEGTGLTVKDTEQFAVSHVVNPEEGTAVDVAGATIDENGTVSFTTTGFSDYVLYTYTVDFHYGNLVFSIPGEGEILLSQVFAQLGIDRDVADVVSVEFSDEKLVSVTKLEGDWLLTSLAPFITNETLTITFADGEVLVLRVTDAQTTYWQRVTSLDQINANGIYMIVNQQNNKLAIGVDSNGAYTGAAANMTAAPGYDGYFTTTLGNEYWWKFSGSGSAWKQTNVANDGYGIRLTNDSTPIGPVSGNNTSTTNTLSLQDGGNWILSSRYNGTTYYLRDNGTALESRTTTSSRYSYIYVQVADPTGGGGGGGEEVDTSTETTYWQMVTSIDDPDAEYMIVNNASNWALGIGQDEAGQDTSIKEVFTSPNFHEVEGLTGYYATNIGNEYWWKFSAAGNSSTQTNVHYTGYGIRLTDNTSPIGTGKTTNTLTYSNGYWTIGRTANSTTYYLRYNETTGNTNHDGTLQSATNNSNHQDWKNTTIYKRVELTGTVKSGSNNSTTYTVPVYAIEVDDEGNTIGLPIFLGNQVVNSGVTSSNPIVPENLFDHTYADKVSGLYYGAYFGTDKEKDVDRVTGLFRHGSSGTRYLGITYTDDNDQPVTNNTYLDASSVNALYLEYEIPGHGSGGGGSVEPIYKAPDHRKYIDAFRDNNDNPDTQLDNAARAGSIGDIEDLYRLYLDVGPEQSFEALDVLFIIDSSTSMVGNFYTGSGTGADGFDATDIKGHTNWRTWALDTLLNGEPDDATHPVKSETDWNHGGNNNTANNKAHQKVLEDNGILKKLMALNPDNKVAVARFSATSAVLLDWTSADNLKPVVYNNVSGTNYVAGLQEARDFLQDDEVVNDGNKKIMIFLSDGLPTRYYNHLSSPATGTPGGSGAEHARESQVTAGAITEFKDLFKEQIMSGELEIYTIGVGEWPTVLLDQLSTNGKSFNSTNFQLIMDQLDNAISGGVGRYSNLSITETLSDDVQFATMLDENAPLDLKVVKIDEGTGVEEPLYTGGQLHKNSSGDWELYNGTKHDDCIKSVTLDPENKKVVVTFEPDYNEEGGYIYSMSFNVKTTQHAYDTYAANVVDSTKADGYDGVKGDGNATNKLTDYAAINYTSSGLPGFYSNDNTKTFLSYLQTHAGMDGEQPKTAPYDKPVVQVSTMEYEVEKIWSDGNENHDSDPITVELYMHDVDCAVADDGTGCDCNHAVKVGETVLNKDNGWKHTFTDLPKHHPYTVVETTVDGYVATYLYSGAQPGTPGTPGTPDIVVTPEVPAWDEDVVVGTTDNAAYLYTSSGTKATSISSGTSYRIGNKDGKKFISRDGNTISTVDNYNNATSWTATSTDNGYVLTSGRRTTYYLYRNSNTLSASTENSSVAQLNSSGQLQLRNGDYTRYVIWNGSSFAAAQNITTSDVTEIRHHDAIPAVIKPGTPGTPATTATPNNKATITNTPAKVGLSLCKVDMQGNVIATAPATFEVYTDANLTQKFGGPYTTENGVLNIQNLEIGKDYWLVETQAPDGFIPIEGGQKFIVDADGKVTGIDGNDYFEWDGTNNRLLVYNSSGYVLPETGGIGTYVYTFCGLLLMAVPAMYGFTLRRKRERRGD